MNKPGVDDLNHVKLIIAGTIQLPGGHLEFEEDPLACAARETAEEAGLQVKGERILATTNSVFKAEGKHYVTLFVKCTMVDPTEEPRVGGATKLPRMSIRTNTSS